MQACVLARRVLLFLLFLWCIIQELVPPSLLVAFVTACFHTHSRLSNLLVAL
jgi:hypothetical protein